jgi:hypothetical protein
METWDAVTGKRIARFAFRYGPDGGAIKNEYGGDLVFLGHSVTAFRMPCAQPCSEATMYSVRGKYIGMLAVEATSTSGELFHDDLYVLHAHEPFGVFVVQDATTAKSVTPDEDEVWEAVVTPQRIVRVVGQSSLHRHAPRVEVWGPDLKLSVTITIPICDTLAAAP